MAITKPSTLKGTRDIGPEMMQRRNFIFDTIKSVFKKFGFVQIETPSMERLDVLTGKYGDEGDQLIFKVLNSGEKVKKADLQALESGDLSKFSTSLAEKAMRYDLTVPFARFVSMNHMELPMPFKRFQIQPVWRADRPQKGRYQEFFQCDADVVGTESLLCEVEIIMMIEEVFGLLGINDFSIKMNNRKLLSGLAEVLKIESRQSDLFVAIDKLDKVSFEQVAEDLINKNFSSGQIETLQKFTQSKDYKEVKKILHSSSTAQKGFEELDEVYDLLKLSGFSANHLEFDPKLARGLSYYTGCIFEVKVNNVSIGSVSGGGRYNNLTEVFGLKDMPGIGFSFGVDRIYDVMEELNLFIDIPTDSTQLLITNFDENCFKKAVSLLPLFRNKNIKVELYPSSAKLKKQLDYANKKAIPYVLMAGENEFNSGQFALKYMISGEQSNLNIEEVIEKLR